MNLGLWKKAYMLEFMGRRIDTGGFSLNWNSDSEIFTFALPPESEDFDYSQRVTETKTFGGAVFDDYGNDTIRIVLSGSTVNNEKKLIYKGTKTIPGYLTGEQEIFKLRDLIEKYGEIENLDKKEVYLYDLSKMNLVQIATGNPVSGSWWRVQIKSLKIKRAKEKPFTYNYVLEMIGYKATNRINTSLLSGTISDGIARVQEILDKANEFLALSEGAISLLSETRRDILRLAEGIDSTSNNPDSVERVVAVIGGKERALLGTHAVDSLYNIAMGIVADCQAFGKAIENASSQSQKGGTISDGEKKTVVFNANGGHFIIEGEESETYREYVSYSDKATKPTDPVRENYEFDYWYVLTNPEEEFVFSKEPIKSNLYLFAKWRQVKAVVSFNSQGGSSVPSQVIPIGGNATRPADPTRRNYIFRNWYSGSIATNEFDFSTPINADTVLYARWSRVTTITVQFNSNGGSDVEPQNIEPGSKIIYPETPTKTNNVFAGWYTDEELTEAFDFSAAVTEPLTLYAKWTHSYCDVTFNSNGGTATPPQVVIIGGTATEPEPPTKVGYTFVFWCSDSAATNEFDFSTPINADTVLYARWTLNNYTVQFNSNGGSGVTEQHIPHGNLSTFPEIPTKEGYSFYKWCSDKNLENEFNFATPIVSDKTLYARWFGNEYTITFETNGGNTIEPQTVENGKKAQAVVPSKSGYVFAGWYTDEELTDAFDFATVIEHDFTIYAKWEQEEQE